MTPLMFASALVQYNSSTSGQHQRAAALGVPPGSELFVVYNEERDSEARPACPACRTGGRS